jgi:hypothetical protein
MRRSTRCTRATSAGAEGLDDIVLGKALDASDNGLFVIHRGQQDDGQVAEFLHSLAELEAVHTGHHDVHDGQVRQSTPGDDVQGLLPRGSDEHLETGVVELEFDQASNLGIIVHHEDTLDFRHRGHSHNPSAT